MVGFKVHGRLVPLHHAVERLTRRLGTMHDHTNVELFYNGWKSILVLLGTFIFLFSDHLIKEDYLQKKINVYY
jgi:hypothetical protein